MKLKTSLSLFLLVLSAKCQYSENRYARHAVTRQQLVGTWTATDFSLGCLAKLPNEGHLTKSENQLVLRQDGSCFCQRLPEPGNRSYTARIREHAVFDAGCTWSLRQGAHQELIITTERNGGASFYFDDSEGRLIAWQYVNDPDAWQYVEFEPASKS